MRSFLPRLEAVAVIVGTIIGAGIVGIPYVFAQSGFLTATIVLIVVSGALLCVRLMLGEIIMRTKGIHQLTGYTKIYIGAAAQHIQAFFLVVSIYGTLLAYMVSQGDVLAALLGGEPFGWSLAFYLAFSFLVAHGLSFIKRSELIMIVAVFFILVILATASATSVDPLFLSGFDLSKSFVPFGVILFACAGLVSVPEAWRVLVMHGKENIYRSVLIWGGVIPPVIYFIFAVLVVGVSGPETTQVATVGLGEALGPHMTIIGNVFAFFAIATSFLTIAIAQQDVFRCDYGVPRSFAVALVVSVPLIFFALGFRDFISIISLVGALMVGVNGLLAVWVFWRARRLGEKAPTFVLPAWLAAPMSVFLCLVFLAGIVSVFV